MSMIAGLTPTQWHIFFPRFGNKEKHGVEFHTSTRNISKFDSEGMKRRNTGFFLPALLYAKYSMKLKKTFIFQGYHRGLAVKGCMWGSPPLVEQNVVLNSVF